jgi:hypothetical protein
MAESNQDELAVSLPRQSLSPQMGCAVSRETSMSRFVWLGVIVALIAVLLLVMAFFTSNWGAR